MKRPVNLNPMDPVRRRWYVAGIALAALAVGVAWMFTLTRALLPEFARMREGFGSGIEKTAESLKKIQIEK